MSTALRAFIIGLIGGSFGGLVGLGGGVVMVPLFTMWAGLSQHEAHGTSLTAVIVTGSVGAWLYGNHGHVSWTSAGWLAASSVVASFITAQYAARIPGTQLKKFFGAFLVVVAVMLLVRNQLSFSQDVEAQPLIWVLLSIGAIAGAIAGLLGVGGGVLIVPLLVLGTGLSQHVAQGTSLAALILTGVTGTLVYAKHGHFRKDLLLTLLPGVVAGCVIGGHGAIGIPGPTLRVVFAIVLVWLGSRYLGLTSPRALRRSSRSAGDARAVAVEREGNAAGGPPIAGGRLHGRIETGGHGSSIPGRLRRRRRGWTPDAD